MNYENLIKEIKQHNSKCESIYKNKENSLSDRWKAFTQLILSDTSSVTGWIQHYTINDNEISWFDEMNYQRGELMDNYELIEMIFEIDEEESTLNFYENLNSNNLGPRDVDINTWPSHIKILAVQMMDSGHRWWHLDW